MKKYCRTALAAVILCSGHVVVSAAHVDAQELPSPTIETRTSGSKSGFVPIVSNESLDIPVYPSTLAFHPDGSLYFGDIRSRTVQRVEFHSDGTTSTTTVAGAGTYRRGEDQLSPVMGIAIDDNGDLYIADANNDRIRKVVVNADGTPVPTTIAGGNGSGDGPDQLNGPRGIEIDADGNLYIVDSLNSRVQKLVFTTDGSTETTTVAGGNGPGGRSDQLDIPSAIALDAAGDLYVADPNNGRVQKVVLGSGGPVVTTVASTDRYVSDLEFDSAGTLYITELENHIVRQVVFEPDGTTTTDTFAGTGNRGGGSDGLTRPTAIAHRPDGTAVIADTFNNRIVGFLADVSPPSVSIVEELSLDGDEDSTVGFSCWDQTLDPADFESGLAAGTCNATLDGAAINSDDQTATLGPGEHTVVVTATDLADNSTTATLTVTVVEAGDGSTGVQGATSIAGIVAAADYNPVAHAEVLRLYQAIFGRAPDLLGAQYWIRVNEGAEDGVEHDVLEVAGFMTETPEWENTFAGTSDDEFVEIVYSNVLGRSFDQAGFDYWLDLVQGSNLHGNNARLQKLTRHEMIFYVTANTEFASAYPFQP